jgi:hypothetical protein
MEKISILAFVLFFLNLFSLYPQNLLLNGDFEDIDEKGIKNPAYYLDHFYALNWLQPTDGTVDIYRDSSVCDTKHIACIEPGLNSVCVKANHGNYCIGFCSITYEGYMEHITGRLVRPLEENELYQVSFALKYFGDEPFFSKGLGYKFSKDSIVFNSHTLFNKRISPFYNTLFSEGKVYADVKFDEYITNTDWKIYTTYFWAKGGERFVTFGLFAYEDDKLIIKQTEYLTKNPSIQKTKKFINSGKSAFIVRIDSVQRSGFDDFSGNYYLMDNVKIQKVTDEKIKRQEQTCDGCFDLDTLTLRIPDKRTIVVPNGFVGNITFDLDAFLNPMEKFVINLNKKDKIIIVNPGLDAENDPRVQYAFEYPARKLQSQPVFLSIEKTNTTEIELLKKMYTWEMFLNNSVHWLIFKSK